MSGLSTVAIKDGHEGARHADLTKERLSALGVGEYYFDSRSQASEGDVGQEIGAEEKGEEEEEEEEEEGTPVAAGSPAAVEKAKAK
jgi:hypothetical protein